MIDDSLRANLEELAEQGLSRHRRVLSSPCGRQAVVNGRTLLAFTSNDYLGLASHPAVIDALAEGARTWGAGSGASHLVSGHLLPHEELEGALAEFTGFPRAITFSTGYLANLAVVPTLAGRGAAVFADKLNHASLIDAVQLAKAQGAETYRYAHNDVAMLERQLAGAKEKTKIIVTDAVFSMDGDLAPLPDLLTLAERFEAWLVVDDAHGFGVLGRHGEGTLAHCQIAFQPRLILMGTLGKAAGVAGAFVAGCEAVIETLIHQARSYIFTTAAPPAVSCALQKSLEIIREESQRRQHLFALIRRLQKGLQDLPWTLLPSPTAIQPLVVGENQAALDLSQALWDRGLWVPAIRPPTVPKGTARLRISLSAAHTTDDIDQLIDALHALT